MWANSWRGVFAAPLPKAIPTPPTIPPPPPGLTPQYRSEKRRKLQEHTVDILREPWNLDDRILKEQEECFQDYETTIASLSNQLQHRDTVLYEQKQNMINVQQQLSQKNTMIRKKNNEISILRNTNISLQTQLDSLGLRMASEQSEYDDKISHYKSLVSGLQKTAENAEESAQYLRYMKNLLINYEKGETLEDSLKTSDRICSICMTMNANVICMPCNHLEYCFECALNVHNLSSNDFSTNKPVSVDCRCPRCKGAVNKLLYIFT